MLKLSLRDLRAHVGRYLLTFLAVTIGVGFVAGVITLTDTISRTLDDLYAGLNRGTDVAVRGAGQFKLGPEFGGAVQRPRISAFLAEDVAEVDGVAAAEGYLQGFTRPIGPDGVPYGNPTFGFPTIGTNWGVVDELNPFDIVEGRPPEGPDEIAFDKRTMDQTGYQVGDIASFQTASGVSSAQIVGVARFGTSDSPGGASITLFDNDTAQMLLAGPGEVDQISVLAEPGVAPEQARDAVADALAGQDLEIVTGGDLIEEAQDTAQASFTGVRTFLLVFALISVLVGTFVIYTSFSFIVAQRQRQVALLRAIGAGRGQVLTSVVLESLVVGAVASLLGYVLGVVLARALAQAFLPGSVTDMRPAAFAVSMGVGTVVTVVSAFFPAARASRVPPVAAMRDVAIDTSDRSIGRVVLGLLLGVPGVALLGAGIAGRDVGDLSPLRVAGAGMLCVFLALIVAGPLAARPASLGLGTPLPRAARHRRPPRPAERGPQPQAHRLHRLGADDRARHRVAVPRGQRLAAGLARRHHRRPLPGRPRRRQRRRVHGRRAAGRRGRRDRRHARGGRGHRRAVRVRPGRRDRGRRSAASTPTPRSTCSTCGSPTATSPTSARTPSGCSPTRPQPRAGRWATRCRSSSATPVSSRSRWPCCSTART